MTGRILSFAKSPHQSTQELLPWFANGTLDAEEAAQVEQHLQTCQGCRAELDCLRTLQSDYAASELAPAAEGSLARLLPRLEPVAPALAGGSAGRPLWGGPFWPAPAWIKLALAVQFCLIFALGWQVLRPEPAGTDFRTLAAASGPRHAAGNVVVVFDPAAAQREVARILRQCDARIVDGPTESNGFVLAVAGDGVPAALKRLRTEPLVVLAEPLQVERTR